MPSNPTTIPCLVCHSTSRVIRCIDPQAMRLELQVFFKEPCPAHIHIPAYQLRRCTQCQLEFADPAEPAGEDFYAWMDREGEYYTNDRWEWHEVIKIIKQSSAETLPAVMEFGAGAGYLLSQLQDQGLATTTAIERSAQATHYLRDKGIESYSYSESNAQLGDRRFDYVFAFHCLEHVADPVSFVQDMQHWRAPGGKLYLSVPYSPMHFEYAWFDPMNHPPHHMTRWNCQSLTALAKAVGATATFRAPPSLPLRRRVIGAFLQSQFGLNWRQKTRQQKLLHMLLHPLRFASILQKQLTRSRINGKIASDVILAEFSWD